jgi:adenylosuccinate lyase
MIDRYTRPKMKAIWELKRKYEIWLAVELAACAAFERAGQVPRGTAARIGKKARIDVKRIARIEKVTKHDVIAFLESLTESVGPEHRFLHMGLTSSDIVDTALAVQMTEALDLILGDLEELMAVLKRQALKYKNTVMVGRSHGIHGEPISFGFKLAIWYEDARRHRERLTHVRQEIAVGTLSGAMGTFAHQGPEVEKYVCAKLGLTPDPVSNQIVQRDRHAAYASALALLGASIEKFATEIRHLQRTEVLEAEEYFSEGQKGSSAMPHKRNPVTCEQICGLARILRAHALAAMENVALWHERDISHSSVERVILPDSTVLLDYLLTKTASVIDRMFVYPARMKQNLEMTRGLIFSGELLLRLAEKGISREKAYQWVQQDAMKVWEDESLNFRSVVLSDPDIRKHLSPGEIDGVFDVRFSLRHVDRIFRRVFAGKKR